VGAVTGAVSGALDDILSCFCAKTGPLTRFLPTFTPGTPPVGSWNGAGFQIFKPYGQGFPWGGNVIWAPPPVTCTTPPPQGLGADLGNGYVALTQQTEDGVCARVRLRVEQEAVLTRTAFEGTLELDNSTAGMLRDIELVLDIRDADGNSANDKFVLRGPDARGAMVAGPGGKYQLARTPRRAEVPVHADGGRGGGSADRLCIGGKLRYRDGDTLVEVPLLSSRITVYPEARLQLDYFWQRDVIGDDPFTEQVEASDPFVLGLQVTNIGKGAALNVGISSAQPQIIENEKGLLVDFRSSAARSATRPAPTPCSSSRCDRPEPGDHRAVEHAVLAAGQVHRLQGSFEHLDSFGSVRTSLIDRVSIHELIRALRVNHPSSDGVTDFLVNDLADPDQPRTRSTFRRAGSSRSASRRTSRSRARPSPAR
jgi:hypothetical protein